MTENEKRIEHLILKYARHEPLTGEEMAILREWRGRSAEHDALPDKFRDEEWVQESLSRLSRVPTGEIWQRISKQVEKEKRFITPWYIKVAGAAAGIALIVVAVRAFIPNRSPVENGRALVASIPVSDQTFTNPAGKPGAKLIVLPDGTQVWLNSASSITYPKVFAADKRIVNLEGEAYFDVAKNPGRPFEVKTSYWSTQDKSTEFNVRAYANEGTGKVTVLEGAVIVKDGKKEVELAPLQQVQLTREGMSTIKKLESTDEAVAWKKGEILFASIPLRDAMKELERRYDKKVFYTDDDVQGVAIHHLILQPENSWEQSLKAVEALEKGFASFSVQGDSVHISKAKGN